MNFFFISTVYVLIGLTCYFHMKKSESVRMIVRFSVEHLSRDKEKKFEMFTCKLFITRFNLDYEMWCFSVVSLVIIAICYINRDEKDW